MDPDASTASLKPRHEWLYAVPGGAMPRAVRCQGRIWEHVETFKHDFFAATGLYRCGDALGVLKLGRMTDVFTIPTRFIGRFLARREAHMYELLDGLPGVPRWIGRVGDTGILHEFVPGHPLGRDERVSDAFFDELFALLREVHGRDMAYVDLNKRQNILVGDDGRPYLIDFQISLHLPPTGWRRLAPVRWLLARFQHEDWYHSLKHKRRVRPDLLTESERADVERLSFWIKLHRVVSRPITQLRRRTLKRLSQSETVSVAGSHAK